MKTFTLTFLVLLMGPMFSLRAENPLEQVTTALRNKHWENAVQLFVKAVKEDADRAEMYYWTRVDKECESSPGMLEVLASHYSEALQYDKAFLFYKELTRIYPENLLYLAFRAEMEALRGKEEDALKTYEQILRIDPEHFNANTFVGNYYFIKAENKKEGVDKEYKRISSPTKMQYANYKNQLAKLYQTEYAKAKVYLQNAIRKSSSQGIKRTLNRIEQLKEKVEK